MENFNFKHTLQVRFNEVDMQGIVFNANYLVYLDVAITDYFRNAVKVHSSKLNEGEVWDTVVVKTTLEYKSSATVMDTLDIWVRTSKIGRTSMTIDFIITKAGETTPMVIADIIYVNRDFKNGGSAPVPEIVKQKILDFEHKVVV